MYKDLVKFIRELYNEPEAFIPLHAPVFQGNEKEYLNNCIDSTFVSSVGKYVDKFEEMVAEYTGAKKAIVTVNGTNALHLALLVAGVKPGHEVITQPLTFIATANAIAYTRAKPVFIDVDNDTMGLSPKALKEWLEKNVKLETKNTEQGTQSKSPINQLTNKPVSACIPMHTFGHPCRIDEIVEICNEYNIPIVEDAAESLGSTFKGKHTGTFGKLGILSFNGNKTLTTGGGGMILTNDEELGIHIKHLTTQAKVPHPWEYMHDHVGYNYRMPNINAALGVAQMERIEEIIKNKRQTAQHYKEYLNSIQTFSHSNIQFFTEPGNARSNYWLNAVLLNDKEQRNEFLKYTNEKGIMTRPIWRLMNKLEMFKNAQTGNLDNAEWLEDRVVNLPSSLRIK
ncbi:MAG: LegC family aminotransferase [Bacteroidales bacterium]|nr:LegC family aminotransferase [Bacteroidales bacterium]